MSETQIPTRVDAFEAIERDRARSWQLLDLLPDEALTRTGLGGGRWSPKDLVGHLESWEEYALDALDAWDQGRRCRLDELQDSLDTDGINARDVERKAALAWSEIQASSERTHTELVAAIRSMTDERWEAPAPDRDDVSVGRAIGGILGGPAGPFRHDEAHHRDLGSFVERHPS